MKQFIRIDEGEFSVDGILMIAVEEGECLEADISVPSEQSVADAIRSGLEKMIRENYAGDRVVVIRSKSKISSVVSRRQFLKITHMALDDVIMHPLEESICTHDDAVAAQQFVVKEIATSTEPLLYLNEILERFKFQETNRQIKDE